MPAFAGMTELGLERTIDEEIFFTIIILTSPGNIRTIGTKSCHYNRAAPQFGFQRDGRCWNT